MSRNLIPVFFTVDERYAPYLSTALISLIEHTSDKYKYDVNVIYHDITRRSLRKLEKLGEGHDNVNLIFTEYSYKTRQPKRLFVRCSKRLSAFV